MRKNICLGTLTGALTGLTLSIIHILPIETPILSIDVLLFVLSFVLGGVGGTLGGWLAKYVRSEKIIYVSIMFGFLGGVLVYFIQVNIMLAYSILHPSFVP